MLSGNCPHHKDILKAEFHKNSQGKKASIVQKIVNICYTVDRGDMYDRFRRYYWT